MDPTRPPTQSQSPPAAPPPQAEAVLSSIDALQEQVRALHVELERTQRLSLLGTMVGVIAHEFNNILTPVLSYCQLARSRPDDAALTAKALERAGAGAEKAARIATAILELTRDERLGAAGRGGLGEQPAVTDVGRAVEDVLLTMAREPGKDGITLTVAGEPGCAVRIRPVALHQVLLNLLINARKAMVGGGRLTIRYGPAGGCSTWNTPEGAVEIVVEDTGCGIPPEVMGRLFEPFATGSHGGGDDRRRGTGLGLAISRRLIEDAGGAIGAESWPGAGTRFTLRLRAA